MERDEAIAKGVRDAWDFYLSQHDISTPDLIEKGVRDAWDFYLSQHDISTADHIEDALMKSFRRWLDDNEDRLLEMIARKVAAPTEETNL
jgi:hypothetical protein